MPKGVYENIRCRGEKKDFSILEHQKRTKKAFLKSPHKGMLLWHNLGSGKTCTSIVIGDALLEEKKIKKVYVLTPGSLRMNWIEEYCKLCGASPAELKKNYIFITYNYGFDETRISDFHDSLVIVDEAHNLINGYINDSKTYNFIYRKIATSRCRVLLLSGTPIPNKIGDFAPYIRLLKPEAKMPRNFTDLLMKVGDIMAPRGDRLIDILDGIISYYPGDPGEIPLVVHHKPIEVLMTKDQTSLFNKYRKIENIVLSNDEEKIGHVSAILKVVCAKRILSRKVSNVFYPKPLDKAPDTLSSNGGWIDKSIMKNGELYKVYSPKITALFLNIIRHINDKHVLFTFFKEKSGIYFIRTLLELCGITTAVYIGDMADSQRSTVLSRFNDPKNERGDIIKILLISEAGAEGISILETTHFHLLESSARPFKSMQSIGRVVRYGSHRRLSHERQIVNVWRYWSIPLNKGSGIDKYLYEKGLSSLKEMESFLDILKKSSI